MDTAHKSRVQNFRHTSQKICSSQDTKGKTKQRMLHYKIFQGNDECTNNKQYQLLLTVTSF